MKPFALAALAALSVLGGCTTEAKPSTATSTAANDRRCFFSNNVNSFQAVNENLVNIKVSTNDVYELTMFGPCYDIDWAQKIALITRTGTAICTGMATAEIVSSTPSRGAKSCQIQSVRYLTPQEVAALPKGQKP